jgi:hypothetical protein
MKNASIIFLVSLFGKIYIVVQWLEMPPFSAKIFLFIFSIFLFFFFPLPLTYGKEDAIHGQLPQTSFPSQI